MNRKSTKERAYILRCLVEGNSIRSTVRLTDASKNTIAKLLVDVGEACTWYQQTHLVNLPCKRVQVDEIWSFVYSKEKNVPEGMEEDAGSVWTWTAICADTKIVPSWLVGSRDSESALFFIQDLAARLSNRIQLTSDGHHAYLKAVADTFYNKIDYAMLVKVYGQTVEGGKKYKPTECSEIKKEAISGFPDPKHISTSFVERQNLTMRMGMRRFTRKTNAFSKKFENHVWAVALHFMYYNFCRVHKTLKTTPAIAANVTTKKWSLEDVVEMMDSYFEEKNSK